MSNHITNHIGLSAEGTLEIQVNTEAQFPRLLKALRKGETLMLKPTNDRTLFVGNLGEETWRNKDGRTRGILFKPQEQLVLALNGKTLTRNFWGGCEKKEVRKIVVTSRQSKMFFIPSDGMAYLA
jgi:hypothetical protein